MHKITKEKTIALTGNRILASSRSLAPHELRAVLYGRLMRLLEREYLENGITTFISGMAVGWDMLCATVVVELKRKYPEIRLVAAIPFIEQADKYPPSERAQYRNLIDQADFTIAICGYTYSYSSQAYHERNDFLVANASKLIVYNSDNPHSGTASTMRKAAEHGVEVVNMYDSLKLVPENYFI